MNIYFIKHAAVVSSNHSSFTLQAVLWAYTQFQRKFGQYTLLWFEVVTIQKNVFFRSWVMDFFFVLVHVFVIRLIACIYFTDDDHAWFAYTSLLLRHRHWSRNRGDCRPFIMESETAQWCYCLAEMKYMTSECFQWSWWFLCNARWLYDLYLMKPYKPHN